MAIPRRVESLNFSSVDEPIAGSARQYSWVPSTRTLVLSLAAGVTLAGVGLIGWGVHDAQGLASVLPSSIAGSIGAQAPPVVKPTGPTPEELARQERARREESLTRELDALAKDAPEFSVAVLDHKTGQLYTYRGDEKYETASVVKVDVLAALLLDAQDDERELSSSEMSLARKMIRLSDNSATTSLFNRIGYKKGLTAANKRLGLTTTAVSPSWGLTKTTVTDQAKLLEQLAATNGPLDQESRDTALDLMGDVDTEQRWGVSAAAREGEKVAIKNGWLPRSTEGNKWIINSLGRITGTDADVSVAVLSHGHRKMDDGIASVEKIAKLTREQLKW
jgi:beta-lactamase class A